MPSDFEFVINSVQFCCTHCDKSYYGTGEKGHLQPTRFQCVQCDSTIDMDQMVLRQTEDVRKEQTQVDRNPWMQRRQRGRIRSWFATLGRSIALLIRLMRATPETS